MEHFRHTVGGNKSHFDFSPSKGNRLLRETSVSDARRGVGCDMRIQGSELTGADPDLVELEPCGQAPGSEERRVHDQFMSMVSGANYPCMMGGQAIAEGRYIFAFLDKLGERSSAS